MKHYTPEGYLQVTGQPIDESLKFLETAQHMGIPLWIRHVAVPGLTDSNEHLQGLAKYIRDLHHVERVELLPYHVLGVPKYRAMGIPYPLEGVPAKDAGELTAWQDLINRELTHR